MNERIGIDRCERTAIGRVLVPDGFHVQIPVTNARAPCFAVIVAIIDVELIEKSISKGRSFNGLIFILLQKVDMNVIRIIRDILIRIDLFQIERKFRLEEIFDIGASNDMTCDQ